jgi:hypothetical protein
VQIDQRFARAAARNAQLAAVDLDGLCRLPNYAERFWAILPFARICGPSKRISPQFHSA